MVRNLEASGTKNVMSLDNEDKAWINTQLDSRLGSLEATIDSKIERLEATIDSKMERMEASFSGKMERMEASFSGRMERMETVLLTEFHKWASPNEARLRTHSAILRAVDLELESVSNRVSKLEDQQQ